MQSGLEGAREGVSKRAQARAQAIRRKDGSRTSQSLGVHRSLESRKRKAHQRRDQKHREVICANRKVGEEVVQARGGEEGVGDGFDERDAREREKRFRIEPRVGEHEDGFRARGRITNGFRRGRRTFDERASHRQDRSGEGEGEHGGAHRRTKTTVDGTVGAREEELGESHQTRDSKNERKVGAKARTFGAKASRLGSASHCGRSEGEGARRKNRSFAQAKSRGGTRRRGKSRRNPSGVRKARSGKIRNVRSRAKNCVGRRATRERAERSREARKIVEILGRGESGGD